MDMVAAPQTLCQEEYAEGSAEPQYALKTGADEIVSDLAVFDLAPHWEFLLMGLGMTQISWQCAGLSKCDHPSFM